MRSGRTSRCSHNKEQPRTWVPWYRPYYPYPTMLRAQDSSWTSLHVAISDVAVPTSLRPASLHVSTGQMIALVLVAAPSHNQYRDARQPHRQPQRASARSMQRRARRSSAAPPVLATRRAVWIREPEHDSPQRLLAKGRNPLRRLVFRRANHPGCARRITLAGTSALISGTDEDGTPFKARGTVAGKTLTVDLGGPPALVGSGMDSASCFRTGTRGRRNELLTKLPTPL